MSRSEPAWRTRTAAALCVWALSAAVPALADTRPWVCLPPIFDGGKRLHPLPKPRVYWLQLLLRQHEICWRGDDEVRVAVFGNSAVYGLPLTADETFESNLNRKLTDAGIDAHLYNLGFVTSYQMKDALILHEAMAYGPDVIIFPLTLSDFLHVAPLPMPSIADLFSRNRASLAEMIAAPPRGLEEPTLRFARTKRLERGWWPLVRLNEIGRLLRAAAHSNALWLQGEIHSPPSRPEFRTMKRRETYDCEESLARFEETFADWQQWNILAELQRLRDTRGVEILVVNLPIAHEPVGDCYSFRYPRQAVPEFAQWIASQARERQLSFIDLHELLPADLFVDSLHVTVEGHRRIADALQPALEPLLRRAAERKRQQANDAAASR